MIPSGSIAIVGAAESTDIGTVPGLSAPGLAFDAASNALRDAGLTPADIDGVACAYFPVADISRQLGIHPTWVDNTQVGGCSWMLHLRNAMAAIHAGWCTTVLILYGESGRSHPALATTYDGGKAGTLANQFTAFYGAGSPPVLFSLNLLRWMKTYGVTEEQLAAGPVAQRQWAATVPRATLKDPITVEEVLDSPMIAWPIRRSMCCLVSDAGGALVVTSADRAKDRPKPPVHILGAGMNIEGGVMSPAGMRDFIDPPYIRISGEAAMGQAGITPADVDHLMIYDAFAHNPLFGLEGLGFVGKGEAGAFVAEGHTAPGGSLPMNTNGGGMSYAHSGSYGMLCMQESIRQVRGEAANQIPDVDIALCHGWGGVWSACATLVFSASPPS